jgi:DNA primase
MSNLIPQEFINDLLARVDIIDVIQSRIKIIKKGQNHHGLCPFHQEKTASFTANQAKQFYYCFGCSASGNAVSFIMQYDQLNFRETIEHLAQKAGLTLPTEMDEHSSPEYTELYQVMEQASAYYQQQLRQHAEAIDYLKSRGLTGQIAKTFAVGYVPPGWNHLNHVIKNNNQLLDAGLATQKENRTYDRFRHRIMFPIRDTRGRTVGFGGRSIDDTPPKYLNSPETVLFHKNNELFGLYEARKIHSKPPYLIVVEGYLDVIALHQYGITGAVATLGTAINKKHIQKLLRYTPTLIFCFDGDKAGQKAAWKALCTSLPFLRDDICIKLFTLPPEHDPDSLIRKIGTESFQQSIKGTQEITTLLFEHLKAEHDFNSLSGKSRFAKAAMELINTMPTGIYKQLLTQQLATHLKIESDHIDTLITPDNQEPPPFIDEDSSPIEPSSTLDTINLETPLSPATLACVILTQNPQLTNEIDTKIWAQIPLDNLPLLQTIKNLIQSSKSQTTGQLLQHADQQLQPLLIQMAQKRLATPQEHTGIELNGALHKITHEFVQKEINRLINKAKNSPLEVQEQTRLKELLCIKTKE